MIVYDKNKWNLWIWLSIIKKNETYEYDCL